MSDQQPTVRPEVSKGERPLAPFEADFNAAWHHYPRKDDRKDALRCYQARRREGISAEDLMAAVMGYADHCRRKKTTEEFMLRGATFFGPNERWLKYLKLRQAELARKDDYPVDA
jgi:hypothetical protein